MPKRQKSSSSLQLDKALDLKAATPLAELLLSRRGQDIELDASNVERLGGQCLQILLSARASWASDGRNFTVEKLSPPIIATLELLGVDPAVLQYRREVGS